MDTRLENSYKIYKDGIYLCPAEIKVSNADQALRRAAKAMGDKVPAIAERDGVVIDLFVVDDQVILHSRIKGLRLRSFFAFLEGSMVPVFAANTGAVLTAADWVAPENMKLIFGTKMVREAAKYRPAEAYLFATGAEAGTFRLPLPNIYSNGRVCLGDSFNRLAVDSATEFFTRSLEILLTTEWGADFMPDISKTKHIFSFGDNLAQKPVPADWHRHCTRFSNPNINAIL